MFIPPGSNCKALRLGVHLILLYFISILFCVRRLFFYFDVDVDVDVGVDVGVGDTGRVWVIPEFFCL